MWKSQDTSPNVRIPQPTWLQTPSIVQIKKGITEAAMLILKQTNKQTTTHANKYSIIIMYMMLAFKGKSHSQIKKKCLSSEGKYKKVHDFFSRSLPITCVANCSPFWLVSECRLHRQIPFIAVVYFQQQLKVGLNIFLFASPSTPNLFSSFFLRNSFKLTNPSTKGLRTRVVHKFSCTRYNSFVSLVKHTYPLKLPNLKLLLLLLLLLLLPLY